MGKEKFFVVHAAAEAVHDIDHGIQFDQPFIAVRNAVDIPEDRGRPLPKLEGDRNDLRQVSEKYLHRTGRVTNAQNKDEFTEHIIKNLQTVKSGRKTVGNGNAKQNRGEKQMDEEGGNHLD